MTKELNNELKPYINFNKLLRIGEDGRYENQLTADI